MPQNAGSVATREQTAPLTVRYFAAAADAAGVDEERVTLVGEATLAALRAELIERHGAPMAKVLRSGSFLVDGVVRRDDGPILDDAAGANDTAAGAAVVDVLPPFAGG